MKMSLTFDHRLTGYVDLHYEIFEDILNLGIQDVSFYQHDRNEPVGLISIAMLMTCFSVRSRLGFRTF